MLPLPPSVAIRVRLCCAVALVVAGIVGSDAARADNAAEVRALMASGDLEAALARAERAVAADPMRAQPRFLKGVVLMDLQRDGEAMTVFTRLSQDFPALPDPYNNIALLHARSGRLEEARQALQTALRNDPGHGTALANLGQVHLMLAVESWEKAAALGALDEMARRRLEGVRALVASQRPSTQPR